MKKKFVFVFCMIAHFLDAEDLKVSSPMSFKGLKDDGSFRFEGGVINLKERSVFLSKVERKVFLPENIKLIRDFVYSESSGVIAVCFEKKRDAEDHDQGIIIANSDRVLHNVNFADYDLVEGVDGIVELGGISESGSHLLAKCAKLLPVDKGNVTGIINHVWVVFELENGSMKIVEPNRGVAKWATYIGADKLEEK